MGDPRPLPAPAPPATPLPVSPADLWRPWWPAPVDPPPRWLAGAVVGVGLLAALSLADAARPGVAVPFCAVAGAVPIVVLALRCRAIRPAPSRLLLGALALALCGVSAVRTADWLNVLCAMAAFGLAALAVLGGRHWYAAVASVPLLGLAGVRSPAWFWRSAGRLPAPRLLTSWATGLLVGVVTAAAVAGLLSSSDAAFGRLLDVVTPQIDLAMVPLRVAWFLAAGGTVGAAAFAVSSRLRWGAVPPPARAVPASEWLVPLVLVGTVIAAYLVVQVTLLFGGSEVVLRGSGVTPAERARHGFGELSVVTVIVLGLLTAAGRRAAGGPPRHRLLLGSCGGALAGMAMALVVSALRRLWLYEQAFGWSVTRIVAGTIELWTGLVLVGTCAAWLLRRTDVLPRAVPASAGAVLLVLSLAGPDGLAAAGNVARYESTGRIDVYYLSLLSADAVPALQRLPEPLRSCALWGERPEPFAWYHANLGQARANASLRERPPGFCPEPPVDPYD